MNFMQLIYVGRLVLRPLNCDGFSWVLFCSLDENIFIYRQSCTTDRFTIYQEKDKFYIVQKRQSTDFKALKL